jgi:hypothetical protein
MITPAYSLTATERVLPKLALDFTTASLDARVTLTRALNTATAVNSSGYIAIVNANLPRFDYNPVTLVCRGLLIEESRENKFTYSQDYSNVIWTKNRCSVTATGAGVLSPDGTANAYSFIEDTTASNSHYFYYATTSGWTTGTYTMSVYVKALSNNRRVTLYQGFGGVAGSYVTFDLSTGSIAGTGGSATGTMTNAGNGWYRCTITYTTTSTTARFDIALNTAASVGLQLYTGDGTSGVYVWGAQVEVGAFATSYIPTEATALTRNADVATMTGTNFSDWFNATEGAIVASSDTSFSPATNVNAYVYAISDGTVNNRISLTYQIFSGRHRFDVVSGGVAQVAILYTAAGVPQINTSYNTCFAIKENSFAASVKANTVGTDSAGVLPLVNSLVFGANADNTAYLNGHVQTFKYYSPRLIDAEVRAFSK